MEDDHSILHHISLIAALESKAGILLNDEDSNLILFIDVLDLAPKGEDGGWS